MCYIAGLHLQLACLSAVVTLAADQANAVHIIANVCMLQGLHDSRGCSIYVRWLQSRAPPPVALLIRKHLSMLMMCSMRASVALSTMHKACARLKRPVQ